MNAMKIGALLVGAGVAATMAVTSVAQSGRTLEEVKSEAQARADRNAYPLIGLKPDEVREALGRLKSLEPDDWAAAWSPLGDRYMAKKDFHQAWLYYSFARWPVPNSPGKEKAYKNALEAYWQYAKKYNPPLEIMKVPYERGEVVGYLRMPRNAKNIPFIIAVAGLDSRKEEMIERFGPLAERGIGVLALDSPGTGQSGVMPVVPGADRSLSKVLDAVLARPEVDPKRVALYGGSYGGYWATILAVTEKARLKAVVAQSPAVHESFSRERTMNLVKNREYLFDYVPAQMYTYGVKTIEDLAEAKEKMSLKRRGILEQPMAPMLVIAGALDTQVPIGDIDILLRSGDSPKDMWIHPRGGHMGRDAKTWPDPVIFKRVTTPWLFKALEIDAG